MPIYEFRCTQCNHKFEKLCPVGENGATLTCPKCNAPKPERVMSCFKPDSADSMKGSRSDSCKCCTSRNCSACH